MCCTRAGKGNKPRGCWLSRLHNDIARASGTCLTRSSLLSASPSLYHFLPFLFSPRFARCSCLANFRRERLEEAPRPLSQSNIVFRDARNNNWQQHFTMCLRQSHLYDINRDLRLTNVNQHVEKMFDSNESISGEVRMTQKFRWKWRKFRPNYRDFWLT